MKKMGHDSFRGSIKSTQMSIDAFSMIKMVKQDRLVDFIYRALKVKFLDMQYENKQTAGWDDINFVNFHDHYDKCYTLKKRMKSCCVDRILPQDSLFSNTPEHRFFKEQGDLPELLEQNDLMKRLCTNVLPDEHIDPSILKMLKIQTGYSAA
jgi:hypothetical protein